MDVITDNDWEVRLSTRSLEFFKIHSLVMPLREYAVSQYVWSPSLTVESTVARSFASDLVEHLADPEMYLSLYGHLCNLVTCIQYKESKST